MKHRGATVFRACVFACAVVYAALLVGCRTTGVRIVASSRSTTNLADINWDEWKWPVFSIYSGPSLTVWVNKDYLALHSVKGVGSVTNDVHALGIYTANERKDASLEAVFSLVPSTNGVLAVESAK